MGFRFKQFSIKDDRSSMKVGTDAVLLGAWAGNKQPDHILDIGSGSGLISLMMAQRFPSADIVGIDIHGPSVIQANENFAISAWSNRLSAIQTPLQDFISTSNTKYDLIVSNPPFFTNSLLPPDPAKKLARHTGTLSYKELVEGVCAVLSEKGNFSLILPFENYELFIKHASDTGLKKKRQLDIIPVTGKKPNRVLSEWKFTKEDTEINTLSIRNQDQSYSYQFKELTREFYLAL